MTDLGSTMLSMVNANRFINMGAIPLVLVAYAIFIWNDHAYHTRDRYDPDVKVHMQNVKNSGSVDALVFGGSNAVYSISAEYLSYNMGLNWYNASLDAELWFIDNYKNFVRELSARIDRTKVRYVVYSSALSYAVNGVKFYEAKRRVNGEGIKPSGSVLRSIVQYISERLGQVSRRSQHNSLGDIIFERQRNSFGDIVFQSVKCALTEEPLHQREDEDTSADFLVDEAIFFASVFPNASILIVLPSEYYGVGSFDDSIFEQNLRTKFYSLLRQYHFEGMVKIIFQPPYSSITQICNTQNHANQDGRVWRTENLIESIRAKNLVAGG
jgi:hypothetical protein